MSAGNDADPPPVATDGRAGYVGALVGEFGQLDRAVYAAIADTPTPLLDEPMRRLGFVRTADDIVQLHMRLELARAGSHEPASRAGGPVRRATRG